MTTLDPNAISRNKLASNEMFDPKLSSRYNWDKVFKAASWGATFVGLIILVVLLLSFLTEGIPRLSWSFITGLPSTISAARTGILPGLLGTLWLLFITALVAFPIGVGTGVFLEEFATDSLFAKIVEINISNLAAVPSIIYGLLGLMVFVRLFEFITGGRTLLAGGLTLALLILPVIIVATRESLKAVPNSLRMAGMALGATKWQTIWEHVLPQAFPGILTGTILGLSRAIGETAPLIVIGAPTFIRSLPTGLYSRFTAMPVLLFNWISDSRRDFHIAASAGIIVLMVVLLIMNGTAIYLRGKFQSQRN
jgi:phosphate transport system permease protein